MKILVVIDMQNDFITGSLGTKEAVKIIDKVEDKIRNFNGDIYATMDTHFDNYLNTKEGKKLPVPHCLKDTDGWKITEQIEDVLKEKCKKYYEKLTFGSTELSCDLKKLALVHNIETIELVGLCTDICVISNALLLKAYLPEVNIIVDANCCAGVTIESHKNALKAMKMCQIEVIGDV